MNKQIIKALVMPLVVISVFATACSPSSPGTTSAPVSETTDEDSPDTSEDATSTTPGSSEGDNNEDEIVFPLEEPVTMTMMAVMNRDWDLNDNFTFNAIEEQTNVHWDVQSVMGAELAERKSIAFNTGNYPDVFFKTQLWSPQIEQYGVRNQFLIPLDDLIDRYAPNLSAVMEERDGWQFLQASDGNIYTMPQVDVSQQAYAMLFINQAWMDNLGLEEPTNLDEYYEVLKAFKEEDANGNGDPNDEIPLTGAGVASFLQQFVYFGVPMHYDYQYAVVDNELAYIPTSDTYKEFLSFFRKLYEEELMDKNSLTQSLEQMRALGTSGDVLGGFIDYSPRTGAGEHAFDHIVLTPFEQGTLPASSGISPDAFAVSDVAEHPEIAVAWADMFYTEEGGRLARMGIEGETYELNEDGTWDWIVGKHGSDIDSVGRSSTFHGAANYPVLVPELSSQTADPDQLYLNEQFAKIRPYLAEPFPNLIFNDEQTASLATIKADIDPYIQQFMAEVIVGEKNLDEDWETFQTTLVAMGVENLKEILQDAYSRSN